MEKQILDTMNKLLTRMYRLQGYTQALDRIRDELSTQIAAGTIPRDGGAALMAVLLDLERRALQKMLRLAEHGHQLRRHLNLIKSFDPETEVTH